MQKTISDLFLAIIKHHLQKWHRSLISQGNKFFVQARGKALGLSLSFSHRGFAKNSKKEIKTARKKDSENINNVI